MMMRKVDWPCQSCLLTLVIHAVVCNVGPNVGDIYSSCRQSRKHFTIFRLTSQFQSHKSTLEYLQYLVNLSYQVYVVAIIDHVLL